MGWPSAGSARLGQAEQEFDRGALAGAIWFQEAEDRVAGHL